MQNLEFTLTGFHNQFAVLYNSQFEFTIHWPIKLLEDKPTINQTIILGNNKSDNINVTQLLEELIN